MENVTSFLVFFFLSCLLEYVCTWMVVPMEYKRMMDGWRTLVLALRGFFFPQFKLTPDEDKFIVVVPAVLF